MEKAREAEKIYQGEYQVGFLRGAGYPSSPVYHSGSLSHSMGHS